MSVIHEEVPSLSTQSGLLDGMPSRTAFVFGLIVAIAASSVIALIVISAILFRGSSVLT